MFWYLPSLLVLVVVSAQRPGTDTRLGLLAPSLGLNPVPGINNNINNPANPRDDQCYCLPVNNACQVRPVSLRIGNVGAGTDCGRDRKLCCPNSQPSPIIQTPPPFNTRPPFPQPPFPQPPVPPHHPTFSQCGTRTIVAQGPTPIYAGLGEVPWMAILLGLKDDYISGGVLVAPDTVITGANKVLGLRDIKVRVGDLDVTSPQDHPLYKHQERRVLQIIIHPQFNSKTLQNNIAILKLSQPFDVSQPHVNPVCLPHQNQIFDGQRCFVTGYGKNAFNGGNYQSYLKKVEVPIVEHYRCQILLRKTRLGNAFELKKNSFVCAGGEAGKDACTGDGGSPLVCSVNGRFTVVGLVAWGIGCATQDIPGVYVNVPSYSNFIKQYCPSC